jgi:hypothetical protein
MFAFDNERFLAQYGAQYPETQPDAVANLSNLLDMIAEDPNLTDIRWAAYMLATVKHECADTFRPIEEFGKGRGRPYGEPVTVTAADGTQFVNTYYGRGYVQLTWRLNYDKVGRALGLDNGLVLHPEHALEPATAYAIMSYGMRTGIFTGRSLRHYINEDICDYFNARRIINGLDRADLIQGYAQQLEAALRTSLVTGTRTATAGSGLATGTG